jgi:hypothetical protein
LNKVTCIGEQEPEPEGNDKDCKGVNVSLKYASLNCEAFGTSNSPIVASPQTHFSQEGH